MVDIKENIDEYNSNEKYKILIMDNIDGMIADILSNETFQPELSKLYIRDRKLNICFHYPILFCCTKT